MGGPLGAADLDRLSALLRTQWHRLRRWLEANDVVAEDRPSVLAGWSVLELVAHLGRALDALAVCRAAAPGTVPLTLAEYLGSYPDRAAQITQVTRDLAAEIAHDPLAGVDRLADQAFARLDALRVESGGDPVVQARRAPILLSEMVVSRLVELVVHADDLARSVRVPGPGPLDPAATHEVAEALLEVLVDRGGWDLEVVDEVSWVRLACGRVPLTGTALASALAPRSTADSLPDLGARLPLL